MQIHQSAMRFKAGLRNGFAAGIGGSEIVRSRFFRETNRRALLNFEQMQHSEMLQQIGNACVRIEQFNRALGFVRLRRIHLQSESCQHAEKRAVHQRAFAQVQNEIIPSLLHQFIDQRFEIDAGGEIGPAGNFNADAFRADENQHFC